MKMIKKASDLDILACFSFSSSQITFSIGQPNDPSTKFSFLQVWPYHQMPSCEIGDAFRETENLSNQ